jgi:sugar lactone lactonase YvrE
MRDARNGSFWHRAGPPMVLATFAATMASAAGCSSSSGSSSTSTSTTASSSSSSSSTSSTSTSTSSSSSSSGAGGNTGTGGEPTLTPTLAANQVSPFDATPDPTGATLYFTGLANAAGAAPLAGVYTASATGSAATPTVVQAGSPYVSPWGISTSTDGTNLYVADPGADIVLDANGNQISGGSDGGEIFVQPVAGGAPTTLTGSTGYEARSVEVLAVSGSDVVYFTGRNPTTGSVGVYSLPAAGAMTPTTILEGAPLGEPGGLAIGSDGTIYVADSLGPGGQGQIVTIAKGATTGTQLVGGLRLGFPSGIALSLDGKALLVSTLDTVAATDIILQIDIATPATTTSITKNLTTNFEAAGLHRARKADVFAFADGTAGAVGASGTTAAVLGGAVYTVK